jgi:hypothetical protein
VVTIAEYAELGRRTYAAGAAASAEPTMAARRKNPRRLVVRSRNWAAASTSFVLTLAPAR